MGGEDVPARGCFASLDERDLVFLHEQPDAFQCQKSGMTLVHVADGGPQPQGFQRADTADAQQYLLPDAQVIVPPV